VADAVTYWLRYGLRGRADSTVSNYRNLAERHIIPELGARKLRELSAEEVDLAGKPDAEPVTPPSISVIRSVRQSGDTKTRKSRRRLAMPQRCVDALTVHAGHLDQPPTGTDLVFPSRAGTTLDAHNVRRSFRIVVKKAGLPPMEWTPRELRHSFVSVLSANDVPIEDISRLVGHSGTAMTETVYRHQLVPVMQRGATTMDQIFPSSD
jgi:hypothetical protein